MSDLLQTVPALLLLAAVLIQVAARRSADRRLRSDLTRELRTISDRLDALSVSNRVADDFERVTDPISDTAIVPSAGIVATAPRPAVSASTTRTRVDAPAAAAIPGPTLITVPSIVAPGSDAAASAASAELSRRFGAIWELADAGASPDAVARAVGQPVGQVELILALRRQMLSGGESPSDASREVRHES